MSEQVLYAKASVERKPAYRQQTLIVRKDGKLLARKIPVGPEAAAHIRQYAEHYETLERALEGSGAVSAAPCALNPDGSVDFPFLEDPTLTEKLAGEAPEAYGRRLAAFRDALAEAFGETAFEVTDAFREIYGDPGLPEGLTALKVTNADLNFDNVFCPAGGGYTLIDYEWILPFPVPTAYLFYRALLLDPAWNAFDPAQQDAVLGVLGIGREHEEAYRRMEASFLEWVSPEVYRMDYFARAPEARHNTIHEFSRLTELPEENRALNDEVIRLSAYARRPWYRACRKAENVLRGIRDGVRGTTRRKGE